MEDDTDKKVDEKVEEQSEAVEEPKVEESPADESQTEEPEKESQQEEEEEAPAESVEDKGEEQAPEQMSRRKAKRLEKLENLVERLKGPQIPEIKSDGINYREMIDANDEVYQQLEDKSKEFGQTQFNAGLEQAKSIQFHTRLEIDAPKVETKYPQFDKESPDFNPNLANSVNQWYLTTVGFNAQTDRVANPNVRYSDFVEGIMELAENMAGAKNVQTAKNVAKQAATTGLRPDGSSATRLDLTKAPEDMTDEELSAVIGANLPRDQRGRFTSANK